MSSLFLRVVAIVAVLSTPQIAAASIIFDGKSYDSVDWQVVNDAANTASGTAGLTSVGASFVELQNSVVQVQDYSADAAFDALSYSPGHQIESLNIRGGGVGNTIFTFSQPVQSVLIFVGLPNDNQNINSFNASLWDFADSLTVSIADSNVPNLVVGAGNIVSHDLGGQPPAKGVIQVNGWFDSLTIAQSSQSGLDSMNFALAVSIPEPSSCLVWGMLAGIGTLGIRRRRNRA